MAETTVHRALVATRTVQDNPSTPYALSAQTKLYVQVGERVVFLRFGVPRDLAGKTVVSAVVEMASNGIWPSPESRTLTLRRINRPAGGAFWPITWNSQPGVLTGATGVVGELKPGSSNRYVWDVTADFQDLANGGSYEGFRLTTTDSTARYFYGPDHPSAYPFLTITVAEETPAPTQINPSGTVAVAAPVFVWNAPPDVTHVQGQADVADGDFTTPVWESAEIPTVLGQLDSAAAGWAGLAEAESADLRFRQFGTLGWSEWSDPITLTREGYAPLTPVLPPVGGVTNDPSPEHSWTFAGQTSFQLTITDAAGRVWYNSGRIAGADQEWTPTLRKGLPDLATMTSRLRVWDDNTDRVASPGDPGYVETSWSWTIEPHAATAPVDDLGASTNSIKNVPAVHLTFTRSLGEPDAWVVVRDGILIARLDPNEDVTETSPTSWEWTDWTCPPNRQVYYQVTPVVAGKAAERGPLAVVELQAEGVWVIDPTTGANFCVADPSAANGLDYTESSLIYVPAFAEEPVKRSLALRGLEGPVSGFITYQHGGPTIEDQVGNAMTIRANPNRIYRLVFGTLNIPVLVTNMSPIVAESALLSRLTHRVSFRVDQAGELPARLT